jgi:hypothetical protein
MAMLERKIQVSALIAIGLGLGLAAVVGGSSQATSTNGPLTCAIETAPSGGAIALEGRVEAQVALSGSYRFRVASAAPGGSTNFRQGGGFSAMPDRPLTLGRIMLGNAGAVYDATLEITAAGTTVTCTERVGGNI